MSSNEIIKGTHRVVFGSSPKKADLAIAPIGEDGVPGVLASHIMKEYGYSNTSIPNYENLKYGFSSLVEKNKKSIILVVTVGKHNVKNSIGKNLLSALIEFRGWFKERVLWLPLLGTGFGGLSFRESYMLLIDVIADFQKKFPTETTIEIAIPDDEKGMIFFEELKKERNLESIENPNNNNPELFLKTLAARYYVVGTIWGREEQLSRFYDEGIWERGQDDDSYSTIINSIRINDILIAKSAYGKKSGESNLKVKAIGVVTQNNNDGFSLQVNWAITDLTADAKGLGYYRSTIAAAEFQDVVTMFSLVNPSLWQKLLPPPIKNSNKIAGLLSDADKGVDYLNISKDITAFARVISSKSFEPPLAIALFGKWGSGKSFFMRKLREQVEDFSRRNSNNIYCEGVVHIHFNAWSYMDANLWASFVSKIFEGLNEYITENSLSEAAKKEIEKELNSSLNIAKEEMQLLEGKKKSIVEQINLLEEKKNEIKEDLDAKIKQLQTQTSWDIVKRTNEEFKVKERIIESLNSNTTYIKTAEDLKHVVPEKYWNDPEEAYRQVSSKYTFLKEFFRRGRAWKNLFWITTILVIIFLVPVLLDLLSVQISKTNFLIPQAGLSFIIMIGAAWKRAEVVYKKLQPVVASFWKIKEDYEEKKKELLAKFEQEEKALKLEIDKGKEELVSINEQISKAETIKADIEFKINNAIATEALYSFIEKRSKSDDYKKHLGIISIIRRDFEILNGLFTDHHQEIVNPKKIAEFRSKFRKPLQRIILYIDDLDRCPEENVVQVLEAVNLLMAFPLFIVIVGVDPRWVKNALIKKYSLQFTGKMNGLVEKEHGVELIEPSNYLEKIFQVPFHLKDAADQSVREMIKQLASTKPVNIIPQKQEKDTPIGSVEEKYDEGKKSQTVESKIEVTDIISMEDKVDITIKESIELLELSPIEVELMQDIGEIIGPNPRAIKRFVNTYKIIKAHEEYTINETSPRQELLAVLFLLGLSSGQFKPLVNDFNAFNNTDFAPEKKVVQYFSTGLGENIRSTPKGDLNKILSENKNLKEILNIGQSVFNKHQSFIKRFTFKSI